MRFSKLVIMRLMKISNHGRTILVAALGLLSAMCLPIHSLQAQPLQVSQPQPIISGRIPYLVAPSVESGSEASASFGGPIGINTEKLGKLLDLVELLHQFLTLY